MDNQFNNQNQPYGPYQPKVEQGPVGSIKIFVFSIISLALSNNISIAGIIFSTMAKRMIATYEQYNGFTDYGLIKASKILSKIGFILSLVFTIFWAFYILFMFVVLIAIMISEGGSEIQTHYAAFLPLIF